MPSVIAAQMYTLREFCKTPADIAKSCTRLKAKGFDAVQASGLGPIEPKELARILAGEGLTCAATHEQWDKLESQTEKVAEEHHTLGCKHTAPGSLPQSFRTPEGYPLFAAGLTKVGRALQKLGITLSYHNHAFELEKFPADKGQLGLDILIEKSDPAVANFEIDTYWIQYGGGDPAAWIRKLKGRIPLLHLKDMTVRANKPIMAEVGEGNLNWPAILAAAREAGVQWYIIEQDTCERDPFESLAISLRNLKSWGIN
jgi:sugar phosphate isomerase/epimerase